MMEKCHGGNKSADWKKGKDEAKFDDIYSSC